jgi:4-amino-4-deoxy-L-arabinose transferase-like glycosyltransferase
MKKEFSFSNFLSFYPIACSFIAIGFLLRLNQFSSSLFEQAQFRQAQTALTTRIFLQHGIELLSSPLPVYGKNSNIPMEMPLYQGLVAALAPSVDLIEATGRVVSFLAFAITGLLFAIVVRKWASDSISLTFLGIFLMTPFAFQWGGSFLIESFATLFSVLMFFSFCNWLDSNRKIWLFFGTLGAVPAFLIKPTTAVLYLPALALPFLASTKPVVVFRKSLSKTLLFLVAGGPLAGLFFAMAWTKHADTLKSQTDLGNRLTSQALFSWNFGTVNQRLDLTNWFGIWQRLFIEIFGVSGTILVLVALALALKGVKGKNILFLATLGAALLGPLIFFNLYAVHSYYLMSVYPLLIAALALSIWIIFKSKVITELPLVANASLVAALVGFQIFTIFNTYEARQDLSTSLHVNRNTPQLSKLLQETTQPGDLIVLLGCDWDPSVLYYARREGVMLPNWLIPNGPKDAAQKLETFKNDFKFVATCDPAIKADSYMPAGVSIRKLAGDQSGNVYSRIY